MPESDATPTHPGWYWFQPETAARALMVEVRLTDGQLTVWWPNEDQPVGKLNGFWRGPMRRLSDLKGWSGRRTPGE
jgi:hypothetical protein